jgi:hypothetical protein
MNPKSGFTPAIVIPFNRCVWIGIKKINRNNIIEEENHFITHPLAPSLKLERGEIKKKMSLKSLYSNAPLYL